MARKPESFKLNDEKKTITLYTNIEPSSAEKKLIEFYLSKDYFPMFEEKKKGKTVKEMKSELEGAILKEFENAYKEKNGFFKACKIYNNWKKENKEKEEK